MPHRPGSPATTRNGAPWRSWPSSRSSQGIDVVLGGGRKYLDPKIRKDGEDLAETLKQRGYAYLTDAAGLAAAPAGRMWGVFAEAGMSRDLDRDPAVEPSLEEMTRKALATLSKNKKGFFLMVEGSQVDWGAHVNDPVGTASEILAFEKAFAAVMDFARKDGHTAVIIAADHSTGGLSIGNPDVGDLPMERFARAMSRPKVTATKAAALIMADPQPALDKARLAAADLLGIDDWKPAEIPELEAALQEKSAKKLELFLARALSRRAGVGWVFTGHGGEDVALYCYHPQGPRLGGVVQNTDIGLYVAQCLGLDLAGLTAERFVRAEEAFRPYRAALSVDVADPENPVLVGYGQGTRLAPADEQEPGEPGWSNGGSGRDRRLHGSHRRRVRSRPEILVRLPAGSRPLALGRRRYFLSRDNPVMNLGARLNSSRTICPSMNRQVASS